MQCINMLCCNDTSESYVLWKLILMSTNEDLRAQKRKHKETGEPEVSAAGLFCLLVLLLC